MFNKAQIKPKRPAEWAVLVGAVLVVGLGAALFFVAVGVGSLDAAQRASTVEALAQALNALFTIQAILVAPPCLRELMCAWRLGRERAPGDARFPLTLDAFQRGIARHGWMAHLGAKPHFFYASAPRLDMAKRPRGASVATAASNGPWTNVELSPPPPAKIPYVTAAYVSLDAGCLGLWNAAFACIALACFLQFPVAGLMWGYAAAPQLRPATAVYILVALSMLSNLAGCICQVCAKRRASARAGSGDVVGPTAV